MTLCEEEKQLQEFTLSLSGICFHEAHLLYLSVFAQATRRVQQSLSDKKNKEWQEELKKKKHIRHPISCNKIADERSKAQCQTVRQFALQRHISLAPWAEEIRLPMRAVPTHRPTHRGRWMIL